MPNPIHRLPPPLEAAVQRLKMAGRVAVERTVESLGLAGLAAHHALQRDGLLQAQFELNRKAALFALAYDEALDDSVLHAMGAPRRDETGARPGVPTGAGSHWAGLSLVDDSEVEAKISADRFGMEIAHACEWELRELEGYVSALLAEQPGDADRSPLKPELVGHALLRGIAAVSDQPEVRKVLTAEFSRTLANMLRQTYTEILDDMHRSGVQPRGMQVRQRAAGGTAPSLGEGRDSGNGTAASDMEAGALRGNPGSRAASAGSFGGRPGFASSAAADGPGRQRSGASGYQGTTLGQLDPTLVSLIRRLAMAGATVVGDSGAPSYQSGWDTDTGFRGAAPPNLIHAHREELRQASRGALDHVVIDVIGFMFDQILADPKVPPQMARLIARLQLPVLRAALGDPGFFSSRRHPVRRFINRIASLGTAFEEFSTPGAQAFLAKVKTLISDVVEGDFEHIEVYEQKLAALEAFSAEQMSQDSPEGNAAAQLLIEKEDQQRLRLLYAQRVQGELDGLPAPAFLRSFIAQVWSQVLLQAAAQDGPDGALVQRLRNVASELYLSVQPKPTPALRKAFLAQLPKLMQDLTEGMNLIAWPEAERKQFFGQLMPTHAEALKQVGGSQLEINLQARQVDGALRKPLPSREELRGMPLPVLTDALPPAALTTDEARRVGLMPETAVDWNGKVDIELDADGADAASATPVAPGLPAPTEAPEPTQGRALADHLEIGFAYQMHLDGDWHKVRLTHVSPARSFYVFTHGGRHRRTVSLTQRMLQRLCEAGRLRAYESAYLIERATARARRQLASLAAAADR